MADDVGIVLIVDASALKPVLVTVDRIDRRDSKWYFAVLSLTVDDLQYFSKWNADVATLWWVTKSLNVASNSSILPNS